MIRSVSIILSLVAVGCAQQKDSSPLNNTAVLGSILGGKGIWAQSQIVYQGGYIQFDGMSVDVQEWGSNLQVDKFSSVDDLICINDVGTQCYNTTTSPPTVMIVTNTAAMSMTTGKQGGSMLVYELAADRIDIFDLETMFQDSFIVEGLVGGMIASHPSNSMIFNYNPTEVRGYQVTVDVAANRTQSNIVVNYTVPSGQISDVFVTEDYFLCTVGTSLFGFTLNPVSNTPVTLLTNLPGGLKQVHTSKNYIFTVQTNAITVYDKSSGIPLTMGKDLATLDVEIMFSPELNWATNSDLVYVERFNSEDVIVNLDDPLNPPATTAVPVVVPGVTNMPAGSTSVPATVSPMSTSAPSGNTSGDTVSVTVSAVVDTAPTMTVQVSGDDETTILGFSLTLFIIIFGGGGLLLLVLLIAVCYCLFCKKSMANFDEFQPLNQMFEGKLLADQQTNGV